MKVNLKALLATLLTCLIALVACRTLDNGGDKDWVQVKINVNHPSASNAGNYSVSPTGTLTSLIMVIPATTTAVTAATDFTNAYDGQLQSLVDQTVTLTVPLNEPVQLVKKTFSTALSLKDTYNSTAFTSIGASAAFTIDGSVTAKTVTISLTSTGGWAFVDGNGATGINKNPLRSAFAGSLAVYTSTLNGGAPAPTLFAGWTEESASNTVKEGYGQIRVAGWNGSSTWSFIDGGTADGLNYDVTKQAEHVNFAVYDSKLHLAWTEYDSSSKRQIHLKAWDGVGWEWTEGHGSAGSATGLNYDASQDARSPSMAVLGTNLFLAWEEGYSGGFQFRVKKWDGSDWSFVDGGTASGINQNPAKPARDPHLVVFNSKLYATWREENASGFWQIRLAELDGISSRTMKDSGADAGFNKNTSVSVGEGNLPFVFNSKLYVAWSEPNASDFPQLRVLEWDGTTPRFVDGDGVNGLNRDVTFGGATVAAGGVITPLLFEYNSKLHAAWSEPNAAGIYQLRVRQWDGSSTWTFVDGDGVNGLNKDSASWVLLPCATVFKSKLYMSFMEGLFFSSCNPGPCDTTKTDQIRVIEGY